MSSEAHDEIRVLLGMLGATHLPGGYVFDRVLGVGGQGVVCAYTGGGERVAVKMAIAPSDNAVIERLRNEASALQRCSEYGFERTVVAARSELRKVVGLPLYYFLMDLAPGVSLQQRLAETPPPWGWQDALRAIFRIAWALKAVHSAGFVHRDLHPGNVYFDDARFKCDWRDGTGNPGVTILDLGVNADIWERFFESERIPVATFRPVGSVTHASPEALTAPSSVSCESDMWSLGVILHRLLLGKNPFYKANLYDLIQAVRRGLPEPETIPNTTADEDRHLNRILSRLCAPDRAQRFSAGELTKVCTDMLYHRLPEHLPSDLVDEYYLKHGNLWGCTRCHQLVSPVGSMCPKCGQRDDDWLHWTSVV